MTNKREIEKQRKESFIMQKSKELFILNGYEQTSMNDIVEITNLTKRTIYKYFISKEDLYFAVILDSYVHLWNMISSDMCKGSTAIEKITLACDSFGEFYKKESTLLKLMSLLNQVNSESDTPYKIKFYEFNNVMFEELSAVFTLGLTDKSIRIDVDIKYTMSSFIFNVTSFYHMLSLSGNSFLSYMHIDEDNFIKYNIRQLLATIKVS